jgi:hypothetical protein
MNGFLLFNKFLRLEFIDLRWFSENPDNPSKESRWVALYERKKSRSSDEARPGGIYFSELDEGLAGIV